MIRRIDINSYTDQHRFEGLLGSGVQHLWTDTGRIWVPTNEYQLAGGTTILSFELNVNQSIATVVWWQGCDKILVGRIRGSSFFNDDFFLVLDSVDEVTQIKFTLLEFK